MTDTPSSKVCTKCGEEKDLGEFNLSPRGKPLARCKECTRAYNREYRKKNRSELLRKQKERVQGDPERLKRSRERAREYYHNNKEYRRDYNRTYYQENKDYISTQTREYRKKSVHLRRAYLKRNRERIRARRREWAERNAEHRRAYRRELHKKKWNSDCRYKARVLMREYLRRAIDAYGGVKTHSTRHLLGYSSHDLIKRMEVQFKPGMSWDNHGEWHIDHKIPVSRFIERGETRPHIINALSNLQPMWAEDNLSKNNRWVG